MTYQAVTVDLLQHLVETAEKNSDGQTANYIPELAHVDNALTAITVHPLGGEPILYSNKPLPRITLQSTSKIIPLIGLLEEYGPEHVFEWVSMEPSGDEFSSIMRLEQFGPKPSNPMLNAGAIVLCSHIPGVGEQQFAWLDKWVQITFNQRLAMNPLVFASEKRTGDRNRSLAYLLSSRGNLGKNVQETLDLYFTLCSYEASLEQMLYLPTLLANAGHCPHTNKVILSPETCKITLAVMATCGLYDESGTHLVRTGMPAKSGVSGYTIATAPGRAGVAVLGPQVNTQGNSIRGELMLEGLSKAMDWHFALT
jgi:glutaminase